MPRSFVRGFPAFLAIAIFLAGDALPAPAQRQTPPQQQGLTQPRPPAPPPQAHFPPPQPPVPLPPPVPRPPELRFLVVIDPAHGGLDTGAMLGTTPEKTYTLALAVRLRVLLNADAIRSDLMRASDVPVDDTARAVAANRAHPAACILLHATGTGNGVHLFTSSLPAAGKQISQDTRRTFLPWQTAQASYTTESLRLESDINAALARQHVPVLLDRTSLMPLDSLACPAVVVEVAPPDANTPLTDAAYQEKIAQALDAAIVSWRSDWRLQP